jgi:LysR family transcriptional regulator, glycine cleavage system transcriptional activator
MGHSFNPPTEKLRRGPHDDPGLICSWPRTCQQTTIRRDIIPFIHAKQKKRRAVLNKRHLPSITALQCFEAVTRHLSFTRAAEELNLTQSAVSKQVAQLEELLQHLLFRRVRRRLQLTPAGDLYLVEVRKILSQVEMSTHYLRSYGGETEVLRVSTPYRPLARAGWCHGSRAGACATRRSTWTCATSRRRTSCCKGKADLAFYFGTGARPGTESLKLFSEELVPVCAPDEPAGPALQRPDATERVGAAAKRLAPPGLA